MNKEALEFLKKERVGVLSVEMMDGSPHGATVHYAHTEDPLIFYFETYRDYRKAEPLFGREKTRASFVVGSDESNMKTLQLDGEVELLKEEELDNFKKLYFYEKFPEKIEKMESGDINFVFFKFTPTWWRFTDWTTPKGKMIWSSED